ncbi:MAG TPA: hypothetical protein VLF87_00645 [Patescibacteria group bacterium]|nr:hypothetical protein [Patescibacteria group bacterium]
MKDNLSFIIEAENKKLIKPRLKEAVVKQKKLTKRELLELANYLYSRYETTKKPLNMRPD